MKKLFENIEGNRFKLLSEVKDIREGLVASGVKKVFMNSGHTPISYNRIESVGLGYIKDINTAKRVALQEARALMTEFGYKDSEEEGKFVKDTPSPMPLKKESDEADMSKPEESEEVKIGMEILDYISVIYTNNPQLIGDTDENDIQIYLKKIETAARRLLKMHGQK